MRALFVPCILWVLSACSVSALVGGRSGRRNLMSNRRSYADECAGETIATQAPVLILPAGSQQRISDWIGRTAKLTADCFTPVLPFVGRHAAISKAVAKLMHDLYVAEQIQKDSVCKRALRLIGSNAPSGAGKTTIGRVISACLQSAMYKGETVTYCRIDSAKSWNRLWSEDVCAQPGMEGLRDRIDKDMSYDCLLDATENFLVEKNGVLFLHFDNVPPWDRDGKPLPDTPANFTDFWRRVLKPIMCTPRVCLYFSGNMRYFDNIGLHYNNPFDFDPIELNALSTADIHSALSKMYLPDASAADGTLQLAQALDAAIPGATSSGSWMLAQTLQMITGGVPLYLEHAMHAMLADADFVATLVKEERRAHLSSCVEALVRKKGGAYLAVRLAAEEHFTRHIAATAIAERSETERREAAAHLLDLALLKGRPLKLSEDDADHLDSALSDFMTAGGVVTLLEAAHVCGVHRQFDKEKGTVTFLMPPPVREGLAAALERVAELQPLLRQLKCNASTAGGVTRRSVHTALALHHHLSRAMKHTNWLGLIDNGAGTDTVDAASPAKHLGPAKPLSSDAHPLGQLMKHMLGPPNPWSDPNPIPWALPYLPPIHAKGKLHAVQAVANAINHGTEDGALRSCKPISVGKFVCSLHQRTFYAFATRPGSECADFLVLYPNNVMTHIHIVEGSLTAHTLLQAYLQTLPIVQSTSGCFKHTMVFLVPEPGARDAAVRGFAALSGHELAKLLKATAKTEFEAEDSASAALSLNPATQCNDRTAKDVEAVAHRRRVRSVAAVASLLRKGKFTTAVLNDAQVDRFLRYNRMVEDLLVGGVDALYKLAMFL